MKPLTLLVALLTLFGVRPGSASAQDALPVSLPDLTDLEAGTSIRIPLTLDGTVGQEGQRFSSYMLTLEYDPSVITITGADADDTITDSWLTRANTEQAGVVRISAASASEVDLGTGPATLVVLEVDLLADGVSPLTFERFQFDEGEPASVATDGSVVVGEAEDIGLRLNEVLAVPPVGSDPGDDEFVEIVNVSGAEVDLSGFTLSDGEEVRHVFPSGTRLAAGQRVTVFGGGGHGDVAGVVQTASTGTLDLDDNGDTVTFRNALGQRSATVGYGSGGDPSAPAGESLGRDPDGTGSFVAHGTIDGNDDGQPDGVLSSPGERNDAVAPPVDAEDGPALAAAFELKEAVPNPFHDASRFRLYVKEAQHVRVALYNTLGQQVGLLYDGPVPSGTWRTFEIESAELPSGRYLYHVQGERFADARSVTLVR